MKIKITSDRMIDLSDEELKELDIATMPCFVNMGGKSYEDLIDIFPDDVFAYVKTHSDNAKTAAKSPEAYYDFFLPFTGEDTAVIHFAASSGISAICGYADQAAKRLPNVYVIDTKTLSNGIAMLAKYLIGLIEGGEDDPKKLCEMVLAKREKLQSSFLIETLEYLYKGGRCSNLTYFAANLLKIKPVITLDDITGKMGTREKCRGQHRRAIVDYIANTFKKFPNPDLKQLYIVHFCKDPELVQFVIDTIMSHHKFEDIQIGAPGCNCAIHCGPNTFGLFYFQK